MTKTKIAVISISILVSASLFVFLGIPWYLESEFNRPVLPSDAESFDLVVEEGASVAQVMQELADRGFLPNANEVRWYIRLHPSEIGRIEAGEYLLKPNMSAREIFESLQGGTFQQERLTFLEGWRREEYAAYLKDQMGDDFATEFYLLSEGYEGKLYPDTYFIDVSTTATSLFETMFSTYQQRITPLLFDENLESTLTENEVLTMASIVEREVQNEVDKALVAGILLKRMQEGWKIEADATVQYALANETAGQVGFSAAVLDSSFVWWPKVLTFEDLDVESAYNTRKFEGLPPTPISNPGFDSVKAVLHPVASEYWFYLTDLNGITRYAATLEEHNENIQRFGLLQ